MFLQNGILDLKVYQKPINLYLHIAFSSAEPLHIKKGLIKIDELRLRDRGYAFEFLNAEFEKVIFGQGFFCCTRMQAKRVTAQYSTK